MKKSKIRIVEELGVACAMTGSEMTVQQVGAMAEMLSDHPEHLVIQALRKASREVKYRLTLADIIQRIDDGHPSAELAWAMVPKSEEASAAVTGPMMQAYAAVADLLDGDPVGARIHFCRVYAELVQRARDEGRACEWFASLGTGDTEAERFDAKAEAQRRNARIHGAQAYPALERPPHVDAPALPRGGDAVAGAIEHVDRAAAKVGIAGLRQALCARVTRPIEPRDSPGRQISTEPCARSKPTCAHPDRMREARHPGGPGYQHEEKQ